MNEITNRVSPDGGFDPHLIIKKDPTTTPCDDCGIPIDSDVYAEELGMCVDCSWVYFESEF